MEQINSHILDHQITVRVQLLVRQFVNNQLFSELPH